MDLHDTFQQLVMDSGEFHLPNAPPNSDLPRNMMDDLEQFDPPIALPDEDDLSFDSHFEELFGPSDDYDRLVPPLSPVHGDVTTDTAGYYLGGYPTCNMSFDILPTYGIPAPPYKGDVFSISLACTEEQLYSDVLRLNATKGQYAFRFVLACEQPGKGFRLLRRGGAKRLADCGFENNGRYLLTLLNINTTVNDY
jgi:hypothetical protein